MALPQSLRPLKLAAAIAALSIAVVACKPSGSGDATAEPTSEAAAGTEAADGAYPGLPTQKDQVSYMIGMDIGKNLEPIKDEIDLAVLYQALQDVVEGKATKLDEEQMAKIAMEFSQRMQEKKAAEAEAAAAKNLAEGQAFLAENGLREGVVTTESGLQYQVLTEGSGPKPAANATVKVHYVGTLLDGTEFDSSVARGEPASFSLERVVPGWQEGVQLMPVGSKYKLWVPSDLGYGESGTPGGPIPPNATLVFEVELLEILAGE